MEGQQVTELHSAAIDAPHRWWIGIKTETWWGIYWYVCMVWDVIIDCLYKAIRDDILTTEFILFLSSFPVLLPADLYLDLACCVYHFKGVILVYFLMSVWQTHRIYIIYIPWIMNTMLSSYITGICRINNIIFILSNIYRNKNNNGILLSSRVD